MDLYKQYTEYCSSKEISALSIKCFYDEFNEQNLSIFRPKKDQCDLCVGYRAGNTPEQIYQDHIKMKNLATDEKSKDKTLANHVYTMDLQSTLLCSMFKASAIYYKTKLVVYNFTL